MATNDTVKGVALGVTAVAVVYALFPALSRAARPLGRAAAKTGIILYEKACETAAEIGEVVEDLVAETRAELLPEADDSAVAAEVLKEVVEDLETDAQ